MSDGPDSSRKRRHRDISQPTTVAVRAGRLTAAPKYVRIIVLLDGVSEATAKTSIYYIRDSFFGDRFDIKYMSSIGWAEAVDVDYIDEIVFPYKRVDDFARKAYISLVLFGHCDVECNFAKVEKHQKIGEIQDSLEQEWKKREVTIPELRFTYATKIKIKNHHGASFLNTLERRVKMKEKDVSMPRIIRFNTASPGFTLEENKIRKNELPQPSRCTEDIYFWKYWLDMDDDDF
jgi:hypothetical protein